MAAENSSFLEYEERLALMFETPSLLKKYFDLQSQYPNLKVQDLIELTYEGDYVRSDVSKHQTGNQWETLKELINNPICPVSISRELPMEISAVYMPERGCVLINEDFSLQELLRGISREMGHAALDDGNGKYNRQRNAFTAYCISYVVCARLGISAELFTVDLPPESIRCKDFKEMEHFLETILEKANEVIPVSDNERKMHHIRDDAR